MARELDSSGVWLIVCDECGKQFIDPFQGAGTKKFQCGTHHGIVKQKDKEGFDTPLNEDTKVEIGNTVVKGSKM